MEELSKLIKKELKVVVKLEHDELKEFKEELTSYIHVIEYLYSIDLLNDWNVVHANHIIIRENISMLFIDSFIDSIVKDRAEKNTLEFIDVINGFIHYKQSVIDKINANFDKVPSYESYLKERKIN